MREEKLSNEIYLSCISFFILGDWIGMDLVSVVTFGCVTVCCMWREKGGEITNEFDGRSPIPPPRSTT